MKMPVARLKYSSIFKLNSEEDTRRLAEMLSLALEGGEIILLGGVMGSGKTFFVRAMARKLGSKILPNSASFNIMRSYRGRRLNIHHFDLFRLEEKHVPYLGIEEFLGDKNAVCVFEWGRPARYLFSDSPFFEIELKLAGENKRRARMSGVGQKEMQIVKEIKRKWEKTERFSR